VLRIGLALLANAIALLVAAVLLDDFELDALNFVVAVVLFTVASLVLRPLVGWLVLRHARPLIGIIGLIVTFVVLLVTDLLSDGIEVSGPVTWILATVIIWLATVVLELAPGPWRRAAAARRR
jgi:uncharacterized membrane protein YvlD (DUF360 family)